MTRHQKTIRTIRIADIVIPPRNAWPVLDPDIIVARVKVARSLSDVAPDPTLLLVDEKEQPVTAIRVRSVISILINEPRMNDDYLGEDVFLHLEDIETIRGLLIWMNVIPDVDDQMTRDEAQQWYREWFA